MVTRVYKETKVIKKKIFKQTFIRYSGENEEMLHFFLPFTLQENERTEMLNHFRSLSLEATVLENNNHSLESEAAEARGALQTAKDQLLDLERQLADKDSLIRGYETQVDHFLIIYQRRCRSFNRKFVFNRWDIYIYINKNLSDQ